MIFQNCYEWNLRQFWNITSGIYAKYHVQIMLLFVYTTTRKRFVIFALSQSNCSNFPCSWNITSGTYAKYHAQIMLLFVYTTTRKRFVIFTCRYFKLSWNTTALSQSNCRNFLCSSIIGLNTTSDISKLLYVKFESILKYHEWYLC